MWSFIYQNKVHCKSQTLHNYLHNPDVFYTGNTSCLSAEQGFFWHHEVWLE